VFMWAFDLIKLNGRGIFNVGRALSGAP
jgi:hypothetical protein